MSEYHLNKHLPTSADYPLYKIIYKKINDFDAFLVSMIYLLVA